MIDNFLRGDYLLSIIIFTHAWKNRIYCENRQKCSFWEPNDRVKQSAKAWISAYEQ